MKLCYWNRVNQIPNFGDLLNPYLWNRLLPGVFDEDLDSIFVGIGTLLEQGMGEKLNLPRESLLNGEPQSKHLIVFGSGAGYYTPPKIDARWHIYCVRGPLTARLMGLDPSTAVTDPGILIRRVFLNHSRKRYGISLMPHHTSATPILKRICEEADINYIDPLEAIDDVLEKISASELLLSEALHGAIVADALRTPWIPIQIKPKFFKFKWEDWCKTIELEYAPVQVSGFIHKIWDRSENKNPFKQFNASVKRQLVARDLKRIARTTRPLLSGDDRIEQLTQELESRLDRFRTDLIANRFS